MLRILEAHFIFIIIIIILFTHLLISFYKQRQLLIIYRVNS